jgi:hypothetical protein
MPCFYSAIIYFILYGKKNNKSSGDENSKLIGLEKKTPDVFYSFY